MFNSVCMVSISLQSDCRVLYFVTVTCTVLLKIFCFYDSTLILKDLREYLVHVKLLLHSVSVQMFHTISYKIYFLKVANFVSLIQRNFDNCIRLFTV